MFPVIRYLRRRTVRQRPKNLAAFRNLWRRSLPVRSPPLTR